MATSYGMIVYNFGTPRSIRRWSFKMSFWLSYDEPWFTIYAPPVIPNPHPELRVRTSRIGGTASLGDGSEDGPSRSLDIDDTFDAVHGGRQLRLFNTHYDEYGPTRASSSSPI
jgi:hypothetical protein